MLKSLRHLSGFRIWLRSKPRRIIFGNRVVLQRTQSVRIPCPFRIAWLIWITEIPCESLGCIFRQPLQVPNRWESLWISLLWNNPQQWSALSHESWHRIGVAGVCEATSRQHAMDVQAKKQVAGAELNMVEHVIPEPCCLSITWMWAPLHLSDKF